MANKIQDRNKRTGAANSYEPTAKEALEEFCQERRSYVTSQFITERRRFYRTVSPGTAEAQVSEQGLDVFNKAWDAADNRLTLIPGKDALTTINARMQEKYGLNVTATAVIDAMHSSEVPSEMSEIVEMLGTFAGTTVKRGA